MLSKSDKLRTESDKLQASQASVLKESSVSSSPVDVTPQGSSSVCSEQAQLFPHTATSEQSYEYLAPSRSSSPFRPVSTLQLERQLEAFSPVKLATVYPVQPSTPSRSARVSRSSGQSDIPVFRLPVPDSQPSPPKVDTAAPFSFDDSPPAAPQSSDPFTVLSSPEESDTSAHSDHRKTEKMSPSGPATVVAARFPPPSEYQKNFFDGHDVSEILEAFHDALEDYHIVEDAKKVSHFIRWCAHDTRDEVRQMAEDVSNDWEALQTAMKKHWKHLDRRQRARPSEKLAFFYRQNIWPEPDGLLEAIETHHKLLCQLKGSEYKKAVESATRGFYGTFLPALRALIRQRRNQSDDEISELPYHEFRDWLITFAMDGYEVGDSYVRPGKPSVVTPSPTPPEGAPLRSEREADALGSSSTTASKSALASVNKQETRAPKTTTFADEPNTTVASKAESHMENQIESLTKGIANLNIYLQKLAAQPTPAPTVITRPPSYPPPARQHQQLFDPYVGREGERVADEFHGRTVEVYTQQAAGYGSNQGPVREGYGGGRGRGAGYAGGYDGRPPRYGYDQSRTGRFMGGSRTCFYCNGPRHIISDCTLYQWHHQEGFFHRVGSNWFLGPMLSPNSADHVRVIPLHLLDQAKDFGACYLDVILVLTVFDPAVASYQKVKKYYKDALARGKVAPINHALVDRESMSHVTFDNPPSTQDANPPQPVPVALPTVPVVTSAFHTVIQPDGSNTFPTYGPDDVDMHEFQQTADVYVQELRLLRTPTPSVVSFHSGHSDQKGEDVEVLDTNAQSAKRRRASSDKGDETVKDDRVPDSGPRVVEIETPIPSPSLRPQSDQNTTAPKEATAPATRLLKKPTTTKPPRKEPTPVPSFSSKGRLRSLMENATDYFETILGGKSPLTHLDLLMVQPELIVAFQNYLETVKYDGKVLKYNGSSHKDEDRDEALVVETNFHAMDRNESVNCGQGLAPPLFSIQQDGDMALVHAPFFTKYAECGLTLQDFFDHAVGRKPAPPAISSLLQTVAPKPATRIHSLPTLFIKLEHNEAPKVVGLIDCGSECNLMSKQLARALNLPIRETQTLSKGMYGEPRVFSGETSAKVILANRGRMQEFFVMDHPIGSKGNEKHVLLGMPFIADTQLTFEYDERGITSVNIRMEDVLIKASLITNSVHGPQSRV